MSQGVGGGENGGENGGEGGGGGDSLHLNLAAASLEDRLLLTRGRAREANSGFDLMHD